jgi:hypothetical protein
MTGNVMAGQIKVVSLNVIVFQYEFKSCPVKITTTNSAASVADGKQILK